MCESMYDEGLYLPLSRYCDLLMYGLLGFMSDESLRPGTTRTTRCTQPLSRHCQSHGFKYGKDGKQLTDLANEL